MSFLHKIGNYYINMNDVIYIEISEQKEVATFFNQNRPRVSVLFYLKGKVDPLIIKVNSLQEAHVGVQTILKSLPAGLGTG